MSTFAEIATEARTIATSQRPGTIDYARMIARLAEAMDTLEHNTAQMFSDLAINGQARDISAALKELRKAPEKVTGVVK